MINIQRFVCNMFEENAYVVSDETSEALIIDCGAFYEEERKAVTDYIRKNELHPVTLAVTHAHIDHCFGNDTLDKNYGLHPLVCVDDEFLYDSLQQQAMDFCGISYQNPIPSVGKYIDENDTIRFGSHEFSVLRTPGHTPGGVTFFCDSEHICFTGDTLFRFSIGRTDFPGGSFNDLTNSLHHVIAKLPADTIVLPGHGDKTTIKEELQMNPYLK
jgi:hydroxyacylglutathione hydrolase